MPFRHVMDRAYSTVPWSAPDAIIYISQKMHKTVIDAEFCTPSSFT